MYMKKLFLISMLLILIVVIGCSGSEKNEFEPFVGEWYTSVDLDNEGCSNEFFETYGKVSISKEGKICGEAYYSNGSKMIIYNEIPEPKYGWTFTKFGSCHYFWIYDNWWEEYFNGKMWTYYDLNDGLLMAKPVLVSEDRNSFHNPQKHFYKNLQDVIANCEVDKDPDPTTCSKLEGKFPCMSERSRTMFPVSNNDVSMNDISMDFQTIKIYRELLTNFHEGKIDKSEFNSFVKKIPLQTKTED